MRKIYSILLILFIAILIFSCKSTIKACTEEAKVCPDGSAVGRDSSKNCEFKECPVKNETNTESEKFHCPPERPTACTKEYDPVCGWFNSEIKCIKYPCANNYGNACSACINPNVESWSKGECPK